VSDPHADGGAGHRWSFVALSGDLGALGDHAPVGVRPAGSPGTCGSSATGSGDRWFGAASLGARRDAAGRRC